MARSLWTNSNIRDSLVFNFLFSFCCAWNCSKTSQFLHAWFCHNDFCAWNVRSCDKAYSFFHIALSSWMLKVWVKTVSAQRGSVWVNTVFADFGAESSALTTGVGRGTCGFSFSSKIFEGPAGSYVTAERSFLTITGVDAGVAPSNGTSTIL